MKKSVSRRGSGGKQLKVTIVSSGGAIECARVTGDFFTHPEGLIEILEERLVGVKAEGIPGVVRGVLGGDAIIIGFNPEELILMMEDCLS